MKRTIFLILFPLYLISATITINIARDNNSTFSVIHLDNNVTFGCQKVMNKLFKDEVICTLDRDITKRKEPLENRFFKIYFQDNLIIISPKHKFNFYPFSDTYIFDKNISGIKNKLYKHWTIVGYTKSQNLFGYKKEDILDFDIPISVKNPVVGELDFELNPVIKTKDAKDINSIKTAYKNKNYENVIKECDFFLSKEENIFTSTAKLYKLRAMNALIIEGNSKELDPMDMVELALEWISDNPSNVNLAEVLSYIAKAYTKMNRNKKAKKYYDILNSEYSDSKYNFEAKLYHAEKLYKTKGKNSALAEFKEVLYNTKDFDIASQAAMHLTQIYLDSKKIKKAKGFIEKIINADSKFIKNHPQISYKVAKKFTENNESNVSLQIAQYLKDVNNDIDKEELDKNIAHWYELAGKNIEAIEKYRYYLKTYKDGKYIDFVKEHLDIVGLATKENNQTKRLQYLDEMIQKYKNNDLSKKALIEKANILLDEKRYKDVLELKDEIQKAGGEKLLKEVAKKQMYIDLKSQKCKDAFKLKEDYNLTQPNDLNESTYNCYVKLSKNNEAIKLAKKILKETKLENKAKWTYELVKLYKKVQNYKALLLAANDLEKLQELNTTSKYSSVCFDKVQAYYHIGNLDDLMIREAQKCAKKFPDDVRNLDSYDRILQYAKRKDKIDLILIYAKKMIDLQKKYKLSTYSPKLELDYIEALRRDKQYEEALKIDLDLLYTKLLDEQKAHVLYLAGYLSEKLNKKKEAKEFYIKCGEIVEDSAWLELCAENLQLLDD